jgi:anti-sigma regulatory factor (Ser/Thr protein kinase)
VIHRLALPQERASAAAARHFVADALSGFDGDDRNVVLLMTSELVTNAVVHGREPIELLIDVSDDGVTVSVEDGEPEALPVVRQTVDAVATGGFGLTIVAQLASRWGSDAGVPGRKVVWFALDRTGHPH